MTTGQVSILVITWDSFPLCQLHVQSWIVLTSKRGLLGILVISKEVPCGILGGVTIGATHVVQGGCTTGAILLMEILVQECFWFIQILLWKLSESMLLGQV